MKIVIVNCVFTPEPVVSARIGEEIAGYFSQHNDDVTVICPHPTRPFGFDFTATANENRARYTIVRVNSFTHPGGGLVGRMRESYSFGRNVVRQLMKMKTPDVIYMNTWPVFSQFIIARYAWKKKITLITHIQDVYPESFLLRLPAVLKSVFKPLTVIDKYVLQKSAFVIAISEKMKNYLAATRKIDPSKIIYIPNWLAVNKEEAKESRQLIDVPEVLQKNTFKVLYFGNIGKVAGLENILPVFKQLKALEIDLIIAGTGTQKQRLQAMKADLELDNVHFIEVPSNAGDLVLDCASICLLPIQKGHDLSSLPSKLLSYVNAGKPVLAIADKWGEIADFINSAQCGWVIDSATMTGEIIKNQLILISSFPKDELAQMGKNAKSFATNNFSASVNLSKIKLLFNESTTGCSA